MQELWHAFWSDDSGQGLVEYSLIIALVAVGLILALTAFRDSIGRIFDAIGSELDQAPTGQYQPGSSGGTTTP